MYQKTHCENQKLKKILTYALNSQPQAHRSLNMPVTITQLN